jgi:hypothetical protein
MHHGVSRTAFMTLTPRSRSQNNVLVSWAGAYTQIFIFCKHFLHYTCRESQTYIGRIMYRWRCSCLCMYVRIVKYFNEWMLEHSETPHDVTTYSTHMQM